MAIMLGRDSRGHGPAAVLARRPLPTAPPNAPRGVTLWEVPPPCQGLVALLALNLLEADKDLASKAPGSAERLHTMIESVRLAFADALAFNCDPMGPSGAAGRPSTADGRASAPPHPLMGDLLSKARAAARREAKFDASKACVASEDAALGPERAERGGDTVYVCVVDGEGNACSLINSNYMGFGTGIVPKVGWGPGGRGGRPGCLD
jgi:gamma-glutamyltranspeptidase/glutathione hydrolase